MRFIQPINYKQHFDYIALENAIKLTKDTFEQKLAQRLNLTRVSAPLFVEKGSGLNDDLNGVERSVHFDILQTQTTAEIVHSLAKWKRKALYDYNFEEWSGLYTDMNAIRRDEELSNIHSIYVDQWDWEKIIPYSDRTIATLKSHVQSIVSALKDTQTILTTIYPHLEPFVREEVTFITSEALYQLYPNKTPKEREYAFAKEHGTICIMQIGKVLSDGSIHDSRAADYDDWELNADILVYYPILDIALELSSMGIRVDETALIKQLDYLNQMYKLDMPFHQQLLNKTLPYTIGGGIGQSRLCLLLLNQAHIGQVQVSLWDNDTKEICKQHHIHLL